MTQSLLSFIIRAKKATYVGSGLKQASSRPGSHDLVYCEGEYTYRDSYFGGTDFIGQECVWHNDVPIWSMGYYGYILRPDLINGAHAATLLRMALSQPHSQGRLLDNLEFSANGMQYVIKSQGTVEHFKGREIITLNETLAYALDYFGGVIKE
jgi:Domain of unknown function (DUF5680)